MSDYILALDPSKRSTDTIDFQTALRGKIVGQEEGVQALVDLYQVFRAGLNSPGRPVGNLLFLGPTGSGKTRIVEAAAEILFGEARAVIKIDCAEFQHSHEIAKLIGSPPGYLGHRETHPLITQETLAASHNDKLKLSFLLFDEIEKASDALWQLLLGMLDKATLTLGDNRKVDLSQTVIFLTSNLGGGEIAELMQGGMGFIQPTDKPITGLDEKVERTAVEAARRKFSPEFMNRLDKPSSGMLFIRSRICWPRIKLPWATWCGSIGMRVTNSLRSCGKAKVRSYRLHRREHSAPAQPLPKRWTESPPSHRRKPRLKRESRGWRSPEGPLRRPRRGVRNRTVKIVKAAL